MAGQFYVLSHDYGPPPGGYGAVVRVDPSGAGHLVHAFSGGPDGGSPHLALTPGADGFLYGLTSAVNSNAVRPSFASRRDGTGFQTLHQFVIGGVGLQGRLFEVAPGEFIGTYGSGGGYVFRLSFLPELTSLSPSSATVGSAGFTLTVNGTRFVNGSQVRWNGSPRPTTFVNEGQLQATISASDIATGGTANVTVVNPGPISGPSNALPFAIAPTLALDKTSLVFGAVTTGAALTYKTAAQSVRLTQTNSGPGDVDGGGESAVAAMSAPPPAPDPQRLRSPSSSARACRCPGQPEWRRDADVQRSAEFARADHRQAESPPAAPHRSRSASSIRRSINFEPESPAPCLSRAGRLTISEMSRVMICRAAVVGRSRADRSELRRSAAGDLRRLPRVHRSPPGRISRVTYSEDSVEFARRAGD